MSKKRKKTVKLLAFDLDAKDVKRTKPREAKGPVGAKGALGPKKPKSKLKAKGKGRKITAPLVLPDPNAATGKPSVTKREGKSYSTRDPKVRRAAAARLARMGYGGIGDPTAEQGAAAVKALDTLSAVNYAVAGGAKAIAEDKPIKEVGKEALKGLTLKERDTFSDVMKEAGVKNKLALALGGFTLDVALDPTTYATFGAGAPAKVAAKSVGKAAAVKATQKALKDGASEKAANRAGRAAARAAIDKLPTNKGVQAGARVHIPFTDKTYDFRTSGKTSAKVSKKIGVSNATTKARNSKPVQAVAKAFLHDWRPPHRTPKQHKTIRDAERRNRAATATDSRRIDRRSTALKSATKDRDGAELIDTIETGGKKGDKVAETISEDFKTMFDAEKNRGLRDKEYKPVDADDAQEYVTHIPDSVLKGKGEGSTRIKAEKPHAREHRGTVKQINADPDLPTFSTDVVAVHGSKAHKTAKNVRLADLWDGVAKSGRSATPGPDKTIQLNAGESIYRVTPRGLEKLDHSTQVGRKELSIVASGKAKGTHVILVDQSVDDVAKKLSNKIGDDGRTDFGRGIDKTTGAWKFVVTQPMPSYHMRNLVGDSINAFVGDATTKSAVQSVKILDARRARNKAERAPEQFTEGGVDAAQLDKTVKVNGKKMTYREIIEEAEREGAIGSGFVGHEFEQLVDDIPEATKAGGKNKKITNPFGDKGIVGRASQYREDFPRLATYLSARKRGMNPSEAAEWTLTHHFDYGDVTNTEQAIRRVIPFWTFGARNTRLHTTRILQRPGKYATAGKVLNEAAKAAGFEDYDAYSKTLQDYQQRGLPIPVKFGDQVYTVQGAPPLTDLNQLTMNPKQQLINIANRVSFFKSIPELAFNYSVFFQGPIQSDNSPRVKAPQAVGELPAAVRKMLHIKKIRDRESGERVWGWPRKVDYLARQLPETNYLVQMMMSGEGSRGLTRTTQTIGMLTGAKATKYDPLKARVDRAFDQYDDVDRELKDLRQQGMKGTKKYRDASRRAKMIEKFINRAERKLGYKDPHFPQGGGGGLGGGLGGGGLGGGL